MKLSKGMLITVGVLVLGALVVVFSENLGNQKSDDKIGVTAVSEQLLLKLTAVAIKTEANEVGLKQDQNGAWVMADGFPVDADRVKTFVENLQKAKIQRVAAKNKAGYKDLGITEANYVELKSADESLKLLLGKNRTGGGQYFAYDGQEKAYLMSEALNLHADAASWELKKLIAIEPKQIKQVSFYAGAKQFDAGREKAEDDLKLKQNTTLKVKEHQIKGMANVLQNLNFTERFDPSNELAKTALASAKTVTVELFDGRKYQVKLGKVKKKEEDKFFIHIQKLDNGKDVDKDAVAADELLANVMQKSSFEVPAFVYNKFVKNEEDIFETKVSQQKKADKKG